MKVIQYIDTERPSNPYIQLIKSKSLVSLGEYDSALTIINNVKEFDSYTKCHSEVIKSNICRKQGKLDQALKLSMGIVSEINELPNNMELLSLNYSNIGSIYSGYGDLNNALDYHLKALKLNEEIGKELDIARSLNLIGIIYYKQGELDNCLEYYKQSMEIFRKIGNRSRQAYSLFDIINTLSITDISKIPEYLAMLEEIDNSSGNKIIHQITRLAQAIYYKTINRMYRKIEAQRLLKEIAKEPIFDFFITRDAMLHLCDLLIEEFSIYHHQDILDEIMSINEMLISIANTQSHSAKYLMVETQIFKAKLEIIYGNFDDASRILDNAYEIAENNGILRLIDKIEEDRERMTENISNWKLMLDKAGSVRERIEKMELKNYLESMISFSKPG